jgi:rhamnosyltransferase
MRPVYHRHQVLVVPLRAGSGTRLKLLEAFAAGLPVVSTTLGAEGIDGVAGEHLLLADDAAGLARAVDRLLGDAELAARLAANAMRLARDRYDWAASARAQLDGIRELIPAAAPAPVAAVAVGDPTPRVFGSSIEGEIAVSVVVPCYRGGEMLARCLQAVAGQECARPFEVVCLDSGSPADDLAVLRASGARVHAIDNRAFNHGLTRDLGAELAVGEVLVYLNQDAIPADPGWLQNLTAPLFAADPPAAVQGAMLDFPPDGSPVRPFFWGTSGPRFYFTREMRRWVECYPGPSFSTVNAALRREAWRDHPFGWAPFMEDKKWQRRALEAGLRIVAAPDARVFHSHDYNLRSVLRRCQSEGYGWRLLGQRYTVGDLVGDLWGPRRWRELAGALWRRRLGMTAAEVLYPWLRPLAVWHGNRHLDDVKH